MNIGSRIFIILLSLNCVIYSQGVLNNVGNLDYSFGGGHQIVDYRIDENLLYSLVYRMSCDEYCGDIPAPDISIGIYDISDPGHPVELGRKSGSDYQGNPDYAQTIRYIDNSSISVPLYAITPQSIDENPIYFSYPNNIVQIDSVLYVFTHYSNTIKSYKILSAGEFQYFKTITLNNVFDNIYGIDVIDKVIYFASHTGLVIVDVSDCNNPVELSSPITTTGLTGLIMGNEKVLVGHNYEKMIVLDVHDPRNPIFVSELSCSHSGFKGDYSNGFFYIAGRESVEIWKEDLSDKISFETIGSVRDIIYKNNRLIFASNLGYEIYSDSNTQNPVRVGAFGANIASPADFVKKDNLLFIANKGDGIAIVNVQDKMQPEKVGGLDWEGYSLEIEVEGQYAYVADYIKGLVIVDVSKPELPQILSQFPQVGHATSLALRNNRVFIINDSNEFYIVDVSNKLIPIIEFQKEFSSIAGKYWGVYKKIVCNKDQIWIKIGRDSLQAFTYTEQNGLNEIFNDTSQLFDFPKELNLADSLIFITDHNGIRIINTNTLSFMNENYFGSNHMEESPICVSYNEQDNTLYVSMSVFVASSYIKQYDVSDLKNPVQINRFSSFGSAPGEMIYDESFLYVLTPMGVRIYSTDKINDVENISNESNSGNFSLIQNYPNPFNNLTTIKFRVTSSAHVNIDLFNYLGQKVRRLTNGNFTEGEHSVSWNGKDDMGNNLASGIYFYSLVINGNKLIDTKRMILIK